MSGKDVVRPVKEQVEPRTDDKKVEVKVCKRKCKNGAKKLRKKEIKQLRKLLTKLEASSTPNDKPETDVAETTFPSKERTDPSGMSTAELDEDQLLYELQRGENNRLRQYQRGRDDEFKSELAEAMFPLEKQIKDLAAEKKRLETKVAEFEAILRKIRSLA